MELLMKARKRHYYCILEENNYLKYITAFLHQKETQTADFNKMIELLTNYFAPTKNIQYQVHIFRQIKQKTNEPIDRFHGRLRQLAVLCDFHDIDREIKTQVIQNCASQRLRRDALRKDMHLSELLATGKAFEIAERHAQEMENLDSTMNKVEKVSVPARKKTCFRCGGPYPHEKSCPATGKKCNICQKLNPFSKVCRNKNRIQNLEEDIHDIENENEESSDYAFGI